MTRTLATFAAAALLLALSGCSSDPEPKFAEPSPTSPEALTDTPTASQSVPGSPTKMVRAWISARNDVVGGGDRSAIDELSTPECQTCKQSVEPILEIYRNGGSLDTPGWRIRNLRSTSRFPDREFPNTRTVVASVVYAAGQTIPQKGADVVRYTAEKHILLFRVVTPANKIAFVGSIS